MAVRATVLYDAPGPKGRRNNRLYSVIAGFIFLAIIGWVASVSYTHLTLPTTSRV